MCMGDGILVGLIGGRSAGGDGVGADFSTPNSVLLITLLRATDRDV